MIGPKRRARMHRPAVLRGESALAGPEWTCVPWIRRCGNGCAAPRGTSRAGARGERGMRHEPVHGGHRRRDVQGGLGEQPEREHPENDAAEEPVVPPIGSRRRGDRHGSVLFVDGVGGSCQALAARWPCVGAFCSDGTGRHSAATLLYRSREASNAATMSARHVVVTGAPGQGLDRRQRRRLANEPGRPLVVAARPVGSLSSCEALSSTGEV